MGMTDEEIESKALTDSPTVEKFGSLDITKPPGHPSSPHPRAEDQPTLDNLPKPTGVRLTLREAGALRASFMGDEYNTKHIDSAIRKIDAALEEEAAAEDDES